MPAPSRDDRFHASDRQSDRRTYGQRDRDRVLYSSAFRRLGGVTQVAAANERVVFRNRLTHTLEVAQIARRLAEYTVADYPDAAEALGGVDPDVVEAAALAHDLGHPPFGHVAEMKLDELMRDSKNSDGFEGNAQSFRVVTKLSLRHTDFVGLNLSRATLNAILKYPWFRQTGGGPRERKWGAYRSESAEFEWARELGQGYVKSVEAELMDWADDIAYSIHDLDDFYRVGMIPLDRILSAPEERDGFLERAARRMGNHESDFDELKRTFDNLADSMRLLCPQLAQPYRGTRRQRASLRTLTAWLIRRYVTDSVFLQPPTENGASGVSFDDVFRREIDVLKQLTWVYVIESPALATQQYGQRKVIEDLFNILLDAASRKDFGVFPPRFAESLRDMADEGIDAPSDLARTVSDFISGLSERESAELHSRLSGASLGSVLDPFGP